MSKIILVLGGIKSGKTKFAQKLAANFQTTTYIATANPVDEEMKQRIEAHKKNRPQDWQTIELQGKTIDDCLKNSEGQTVIIDCLGNLVSNSMENNTLNGLKDFPKVVANNKHRFKQLILVSNDVSLSLVSNYESGRRFCDAIGIINQKIAGLADEVYLLVAGQSLRLKQKGE